MADLKAYKALKAKLGDKLWRLNNLYKITDVNGDVITLKLNEEQMDYYQSRHYFNVCLKARQLGFSTLIQIDGLDTCLFNSNVEFGIIAQSLDDARSIFQKKIKFAYENLPQSLRDSITATTDSANEIRFSNGSGIRVGTSLRGGTLQRLHVSEYGKIAAKYPEKAKEIKTGALNTVHAGQLIDIESTAEGVGGEFYDLCQRAEHLGEQEESLTTLDPKFHFYPWWMKTSYRISHAGVYVTQSLKDYFKTLEEDHGISLDREQRAWYAKKSEQMGDSMKQEFPSTAKEPFEVAVEGAYYGREMTRMRHDGRICRLPVETGVPIDSYWDLGRNDLNSIWLKQSIAKEERWVGYYQNSGESLAHYVAWMQEWLPNGCQWGAHYLPHDASVTDLSRVDNKTREQVIQDLGLKRTVIVPRVDDIRTGIELTRTALASCWIDAESCAEGIACLDNYRKEWNEKLATWRDYPRHDKYSNGADAFRQWAQSRERYSRKDWSDAPPLETPWVL